MTEQLKHTPLFAGMTDTEIDNCLVCSGSLVTAYEKEQMIFRQGEVPRRLMVLLEGTVVVGNDTSEGKRNVIATFNRAGELFGEVFVFLGKKEYDHYAQAASPAKILHIPREFLYHACAEDCSGHTKMVANMLSVLAQKAYFLNRRLQVMSCASLRQKIAKLFLQHAAPDGKVLLSMNREELADFLNTARPSLSRELMKMQEDKLLQIEKKVIIITDQAALQDIL